MRTRLLIGVVILVVAMGLIGLYVFTAKEAQWMQCMYVRSALFREWRMNLAKADISKLTGEIHKKPRFSLVLVGPSLYQRYNGPATIRPSSDKNLAEHHVSVSILGRVATKRDLLYLEEFAKQILYRWPVNLNVSCDEDNAGQENSLCKEPLDTGGNGACGI